MLNAGVVEFDDEKVEEDDSDLEAPVEEQFEEDFPEEVHGDVVPPLWGQPVVKVVDQN